MKLAEIRTRKSILATMIPLLQAGGCSADALYSRTHSLSANKDTTSIDVSQDSDEGVKLRVFDGERYHEVGLSGFDELSLRRAAKRLGRTKRVAKTTFEAPPLEADYSATGRIDASKIPIKKKIAMVEKLHAQLMASSKKLINARLYYDESREIKIFVSETRRLSQRINGCLVVLLPYVQTKEGETRYHYESLFDHGYEATVISMKRLRAIARFTEKVATAKKLKPGKYECILSPGMAGLLAHESFGHGMEADTLYKGRAMALQHLGKRIAGAHVSIADGPLEKGAHGFFFFDDEGFLATKALMVDKGIVKQPLTDAYNAAKLGVPRTSNARAESFDHKVYARMTNTFFEPGEDSKVTMIRSVKDGLFLHHASGGMEDPKGWGIQIQGVVAERIKQGKLTGELFYEIGFTGYLPDVLKHIIGVSKEFEIPGTGRCGKGHKDWVRVAEGGPYLRIKEVVLS